MLLSKNVLLFLLAVALVMAMSFGQDATPTMDPANAINDDRCKDVTCITLACDEFIRSPDSCCPVCIPPQPSKVPPPIGPIGPLPTQRPVGKPTPKTKPPLWHHLCKIRCAKPHCKDPQWVKGKCCPVCLPTPEPIDCSLVRCAKPIDCRVPLITPPGECCLICPPVRGPPESLQVQPNP